MSLLSDTQLTLVKKIEGCEVLHDVEMKKFSTMKLSSFGTLVKVSHIEALKELVQYFANQGIAFKCIGWGANFILPEKPNFVLIKLDIPFDKRAITPDQKVFDLPASAPLNVLTSLAVKYGFKGWEVFTGVPASLGGAIAMNAGTNLGEICELLESVQILRADGSVDNHIVTDNSFSYRANHILNEGDIIIGARIFHKGIDPTIGALIKEYLKKRTDSQPLKEKTCGCMFKNKHLKTSDLELTCRAGLYLDIMGAKGLNVGDMRISPKHANFMENHGESGSEEVKELVSLALSELELHYGVKFETEAHLP